MKLKKIPFTIILTAFIWLIIFFGLSIGGFYCTISLKAGVVIIFVTVVSAIMIKMMASVGQILLDFHRNMIKANDEIKHVLKDNLKALHETQMDIKHIVTDLNESQLDIKHVLKDNLKALYETQMDIKHIVTDLNESQLDIKHMLKDNLKALNAVGMDTILLLEDNLKAIEDKLKTIHEVGTDSLRTMQHMNCDSKDINKMLYEIRLALEKLNES
jgi:methyl-accepting chemotaxis protein